MSRRAFSELLFRTLAEDVRPLLSRLTAPVLLLRPTFTVSFFPGELRAFKRCLPGLQVHELAGDQTFPFSNPLDTAAAMARFLDAR